MARQRVPEGPAPDPAVQRLRIRYAKRGRLRFSSSRDFQRALERALRRADVPMAFSAGFHPHPKISYANAAATGSASEAEYVEIQLTQRVDPERLRVALDAALPDGLDVLQVAEALPGSLADRLEGSIWRIELPGVSTTHAETAVRTLLDAPRVEVTRMTKNGPRTFDARGAVLEARVDDAASQAGSEDAAGACAILTVVARHTTPAVRPDDILTALRAVADLVPAAPPLVTRMAQGPLRDTPARVADPLAADESVAGA